MNLAVHGLSGDIREANSYYDDPHKLDRPLRLRHGQSAVQPSEVDRAKLVNEAGKVDARFPFGLPTVNNANYLWIKLFYAALNADRPRRLRHGQQRLATRAAASGRSGGS